MAGVQESAQESLAPRTYCKQYQAMRPLLVFIILLAVGCLSQKPPMAVESSENRGVGVGGSCGGEELTVHFYDAGQALAVLVELPGGQKILVDTGESPSRHECQSCVNWSKRVLSGLKEDLGGDSIDMLWITHPHSDHLGNAAQILREFSVLNYVDNGRELRGKNLKEIRQVAYVQKVPVTVIDSMHTLLPIQTPKDVRLRAIVPSTWNCSSDDANNCSIGLRIDYCASSILFVGDAEKMEEGELDTHGAVTLLQVGHHGSNTSSTQQFIDRVQPRYAVISSAKRGEGTNRGYCHPSQSVVERLTVSIGGAATKTIKAFDDHAKCDNANANWSDTPASDNLWSTAQGGTVRLTTNGNGRFAESRKSKSSAVGDSSWLEPSAMTCCKICKAGKPCGDSCISSSSICRKAPGCACAG